MMFMKISGRLTRENAMSYGFGTSAKLGYNGFELPSSARQQSGESQ